MWLQFHGILTMVIGSLHCQQTPREMVGGAVLESINTDSRKQSKGGRWNEYEKLDHINVLEMNAGLFGLRSFSEALCNTHVKLNMDSTTAVAYVQNMGGSKSRKCNALAQMVWEFCQKHQIWLTAAHLPGHLNVLADEKYRVQR